MVSSEGGDRIAIWHGARAFGQHPLQRLHNLKGRVVDVKFLPAGDRLVTASSAGEAVVWSAASGLALRELRQDVDDAKLYQVQAPMGGVRFRLGVIGSAKSAQATRSAHAIGSVQAIRSGQDMRSALVVGLTQVVASAQALWSALDMKSAKAMWPAQP